MAKLPIAEYSIERVEHDTAYFLIFDGESNRRLFKSQVYTRRDNAQRGAHRWCAKHGYKSRALK